MRPQQLNLGPIEETAMLTLHARALDSTSPTPILHDTLSAELADMIDYDFAKLKVSRNLVVGTALRAKRLDEAVKAFTITHPDAVVLDLGCGLDTRVFRCDPPAGIDWYDVDLPDVITLRTRYLPQHLPQRSVHIDTDLTTPGWLDRIPDDRPAMIVADGVFPFLPGDSFQVMTRALTAHFPAGELALNGYTRFAAWAMKYHPAIKAIGLEAAQGFDDPHEPETWAAGLTLIEEQLLTRAPEVAQFPSATRTLSRLMARSVSLSRQGTRILRYRF